MKKQTLKRASLNSTSKGPTDGDPCQRDNGHERNPNSHCYQSTKDAKTVSSNSPASATLRTVLP